MQVVGGLSIEQAEALARDGLRAFAPKLAELVEASGNAGDIPCQSSTAKPIDCSIEIVNGFGDEVVVPVPYWVKAR